MRVFLLVQLFAGVEVSAETPLPFGIRVQDVESLEQHHSNVVFETDLLANVDASEQALRVMERRLGPYHPDLAPALVETANLSLAIGDIEGAEQYLDQALHNAWVITVCTETSSCRYYVACWICSFWQAIVRFEGVPHIS